MSEDATANTPAAEADLQANSRHLAQQPWHAMAVEAVAGALDTDPTGGLARREARRRLSAYGPNQLRRSRATPWWQVLAAQFKSLVVALLAVAVVTSMRLPLTSARL